MTKTAVLFALVVTALASMPAHAQRVFVSGQGSDKDPCTAKKPCRTFQQAFNTAPANGVIEVLDPEDYGPVTITHGISIQGHGFGGITQTCNTCAAITINVPPSLLTGDPVTLDGLRLDGAGTGFCGVLITSGPSVQILNSVTRRFFQSGIIHNTSTNFNTLLIEDTIASDNLNIGFTIRPSGGSVNATLNRITAINSQTGVAGGVNSDTTIANSVISNNSSVGVQSEGVIWLAKTVISGNGNGVNVLPGSTANTYGDNYIRDNGTPVESGSLTPVSTQ